MSANSSPTRSPSRCADDQLGGDPVGSHQVGLGQHRQHRGVRQPGQLPGDEAVPRPDLGVGGQQQRDHVDLGPGLADHGVQPLAEQRPGPVQAGRVDQDQLGVRPGENAAQGVPGGLRPAAGDGHLRADQRVGEGGLARVRPADEAGEAGAGGRHRTILSGPCGAVGSRRRGPVALVPRIGDGGNSRASTSVGPHVPTWTCVPGLHSPSLRATTRREATSRAGADVRGDGS